MQISSKIVRAHTAEVNLVHFLFVGKCCNPGNQLEMASANGNFAFSKAGDPCFNGCDAYLDDILSKGTTPEVALDPSTPLAGKFISAVSAQRNLLKEIRSDLEIQLQGTSNLGTKGHDLPSEGGTNIKDSTHQLLLVCSQGKMDLLQDFIAKSFDLNTTLSIKHCPEGLIPLSVASITNQSSMCTELIRSGAQVNRVDSRGLSALHWAVLAHNSSVVKVLLANGAKLDLVDCEGLSPLHYGCISGPPQLAGLLIKECPSLVGYVLPDGVNSVMLACCCGHQQLVKLLLKQGTGLALRGDGSGMCAVHYAVWSGSVKCLKVVASHTSWREALAQRDVWGRTPLITAAAKGDPVMCQFLLKKGATLSEVDGEGRGTLHWAALSREVSCVEFLVRCKGDVALCRLQDNTGACAVHYAAIQTDTSVLAVILKQDPRSASVTTHRGATALSWAALCGRLDCVRLLLEGEGEGGGVGGLHGAACVGAVEVCEALLTAGAMVDEVSEGCTPLHYASRLGHVECVKFLLSHGAAVDSVSSKQESGLHLAVMYGHSDVARELLEGGANRDRPLPPTGSCPIHLACSHGHSEVLQVVIRAGGSVNQPRASDDHTPLYIAASLGHLDCCKVLIQHGADTGTRINPSTKGLTALDVSMANGHSGCTSYLMACHAPSGGGVYHRAALTIQAVWRYYRHKCRQAITRYWSVVVLQRCVRRWLCGVKAVRVRQARLAARHRAARTIQLRWREYIREKRRYEATCARLKAQLKQEQLAASLIIAELQAQTLSVSLPSTLPPGQQHKERKSHRLLKLSSQLRCSVFPGESRTVPSRPRRPLLTHSPPSIKLQPSSRRDASNGKPITSHIKTTHLPPVSPTHPTTPPQYSTPTSNKTLLPTLLPVTPANTSSTQGRANVTTKMEKLPPIPAVSSVTVQQATGPKDEVDTGSHPHPRADQEPRPHSRSPLELRPYPKTTRTPPTTPTAGRGDDSPRPSSPPSFKIPSYSQRRMIRRSSTFKATPLGYRGYVLRDKKKSDQSASSLSDLSDFRLDSCGEGSTTVSGINLDVSKVSFAEGLNVSISPPEGVAPDEGVAQDEGVAEDERIQSGNGRDTVRVSEDLTHVPEDLGEQKKLLNQVERFERLMKVLTLLKGTTNMAEFAREGEERGGGEREGGGVGTMEELKDYIKLALDEAVQLRVETAEMTMEKTAVQSDPVSS